MIRKKSLKALLVIPALFASSSVPALSSCPEAGGSYTPVSMAPLDQSPTSYARAVNSVGAVVGESSTPDNSLHAYLWQRDSFTDLGTLGGSSSDAKALNDLGSVVGFSSIAANLATHAFLWSDGTMLDLGTLGGRHSYAYGINNAGQVTGISYLSSGRHAFLWESGVMTDLLVGNGFSTGNAINNHGQVAGTYLALDGMNHAFLWDKNGWLDLGTFGGSTSTGVDVNDNGTVVGNFTLDNIQHGFIWKNGDLTDLGPNTTPVAINNRGQVTGSILTDTGYVPFVYDKGQLTPLPDATGAQMSDINDNGYLVGSTYGRATLMQPAMTSSAPETSAQETGTQGNADWFLGPVQVTLQGGIADCPDATVCTWYTLDGSDALQYGDPLSITGDGVHTLTFWSVDGTATAGAKTEQKISIDSTPPVVLWGDSPSGWVNHAVEVPFTVSDATSGLGNATPSPLSFTQEGAAQTASVTASDIAGNEITVPSPQVSIDMTPPQVSAIATPSTLWPPDGSMDQVTVTGSVKDALSGAGATGSFQVSDEYGEFHTTGSVTIAPDGSFSFSTMLEAARYGTDLNGRLYTITVNAQDAAGNAASTNVTVTVLHDRR